MSSPKRSTTDLFIILANLVPIWGVWFRHWDPHQVFLVYCLETILLGLYNLLKIGLTALNRKPGAAPVKPQDQSWPVLLFMAFFALHYGIFVFVQLSLFLGVSAGAIGTENVMDLLLHLDRYLSPGGRLLLLVFAVSYGLIMIKDYLMSGAFRHTTPARLIFEPYGRILVQQFTVIIGSVFLLFGAGTVFVTLFAALKTFFDIRQPFRSSLDEAAKKMEGFS